ncbi:hypothetical protein HAX54_036748 [Datura stramonium]|uniref:Uncharacterized protein n=1 Tax=Datura stramonium TaxID=4076 RepID=A0ABS8VKL0_DATST|nr:hypothetical protein [Datura stramonium]
MVVAWVCGAGVVSPEVRKGDEKMEVHRRMRKEKEGAVAGSNGGDRRKTRSEGKRERKWREGERRRGRGLAAAAGGFPVEVGLGGRQWGGVKVRRRWLTGFRRKKWGEGRAVWRLLVSGDAGEFRREEREKRERGGRSAARV